MNVEGGNDTLKDLDETIVPKITCQRTAELQAKLKSIVEQTLENVTAETFVKAYKTCYQGFEKKDDLPRPSLSGSSKEAKAYREQFNSIVRENLFGTVDETISSMDDNLLELENLIKSQADSTFVWRPPGDAYKHMEPFDMVAKLEEKKELEDRVAKEDEVIDLLKKRLTQKRNKAIALNDKLLEKIDDISNLMSSKTIESES